MARLPRPWSGQTREDDVPFGPQDCLLSEGELERGEDKVPLMFGSVRDEKRPLWLHPYPRKGSGDAPKRAGFPIRPKIGAEPQPDEDTLPFDTLRRMNEVMARLQELEEALDDPMNVWSRLRDAWKRAENEEDPRMAEIVRQARDLGPVARDLEKRIRRVLRRHRELTPLDRVQEMDRASMVWLSRQPGRRIAERAGASQRILATVRRENFDTLENRVLRSWLRLAEAVAREWLREHKRASESARFWSVEALRKLTKRMDQDLDHLGVGIAHPGITPNYVLMQDRSYRRVHDAWLRLLKRDQALDELWAWQAQAWTDFSVLAIVLALDELPGSELIAQSPMLWHEEARAGRWFDQDRPLAVFWLKQIGRVVEVQARPEQPGSLLTVARAHVALRISDPTGQNFDQRVPVWTPHAMHPFDVGELAQEALGYLAQLRVAQRQLNVMDSILSGLILAPTHHESCAARQTNGELAVNAISLGASGDALRKGIAALKAFAEGQFSEAPAWV